MALAQYLPGTDPEGIVAEAAEAGAEIVVLPEMWSNGYRRFDPASASDLAAWKDTGIPCDGAFVRHFRELAQARGLHIVVTFLEAGFPKPFNSALLIDPRGRTALHHRKVFICDFDSPELACGRGSEFAVAGIETDAGRVSVGLMICMDREFPEAASELSRAGAEIALVPNCCDLASDKVVGDVRIAQTRGRAFESVIGIAVANYPAPRCDGHSFAVHPTGAVIAMGGSAPGLVLADFDLELIRSWRAQDRFRWDGSHRRPTG